MKRGNITFFILKQAIFDNGFETQNPITIIPKISATVAKIAWNGYYNFDTTNNLVTIDLLFSVG